MRKKDGEVSYNLRLSSDLYDILKNHQITESVRLHRIVSINEIIQKAIKKAATSRLTED